MYLTKLILNVNNRYIRYNLSDQNIIHKFLLEKGFGTIEGEDIRKTLGVLYSLNNNIIIMQSLVKPKFEYNRQYFAEEPRTIIIDKVKELLIKDNIVHFECTCNPAKKSKGKRLFLTDSQERIEWFKRKINEGGAEVQFLDESPENTVFGKKKTENNIHKIYAKSVKFKGVLKVTDGEKLWETLSNGIGHEKAYGCGMLMITK